MYLAGDLVVLVGLLVVLVGDTYFDSSIPVLVPRKGEEALAGDRCLIGEALTGEAAVLVKAVDLIGLPAVLTGE